MACVQKAKTAFAFETGRIAAMIEREIMTGDPDYMLNRIPETSFDTSQGHNPRTVRVNIVPPRRTEYQEGLAPAGTDNVNYVNPLTDGIIASNTNKTGALCSIPGETIHWGTEEFGRRLRYTALETDPMCVLDLLEKKAVGATIQKLREALPRFAKEHFGNELKRQVIKNSYFKYSVTATGLARSQQVPYFPAIPEGGASIGLIRRIENDLRRQGWNQGSKTPVINGRPALQVYMGRDDIEFAIRDYKRANGIVIQQDNITVDDPTFGKTVVYNGIQFIEDSLPTKGYVIQKAPGLYEFVEIQPWIVEAGVQGIISRPNPQYDQGWINVGGEVHPVLSMGYIVHPRAMERQAMGAIPKIDGKPGNKMFNFEVNMVPDWAIAADPRCNKDMLYVAYRLTHAYAPLPYNPELMSVFLYMAATPQFTASEPNRYEGSAPNQPITPAPFGFPKAGDCAACTTDSDLDPRLVANRTEENLYPANGAGTIQHNQIAYYVEESTGGLTVGIRRVGGTVGAASVVATKVEGTATSPENFTEGSPVTLNWADGVGGIKTFTVPINAAGTDDDGKQFTIVLSSATGATLSSNTTATVTFVSNGDDE